MRAVNRTEVFAGWLVLY